MNDGLFSQQAKREEYLGSFSLKYIPSKKVIFRVADGSDAIGERRAEGFVERDTKGWSNLPHPAPSVSDLSFEYRTCRGKRALFLSLESYTRDDIQGFAE
ncbi:hypothetical protein CDAR_40751 [Caerostris darwini]|uniref:Uncharacterized protein n=1 Tax=Caerostris darwini TaxID=1538125 RepID=A0AAV4TIV0_9ARAC|nr:hypothetical protein CDAR_40751 [Caerostris darwini]